MKCQEARTLLNSLLNDAERSCGIAKVAARNKKSLAGANPYGERFHAVTVVISTTEAKVRPLLAGLDLLPSDLDGYSDGIAVLKSTDALTAKQRADALKRLRLLCESVILPKIEGMQASPIPASEGVLLMSVVKCNRPYIEKVVLQANGTYEHQWYDACSVMIRRLVETLIIEVYEAKGKAGDIKGSDGHYQMLGKLVDKMLADPVFHLGRETKKVLPLLKSLGDRAAHNRHFTANKGDIDAVTHDLRVLVPEFLNLAGINRK